MKRHVLCCTAMCLCLVGLPAAAAEEAPTRVVRYADLDLSSAPGRQALERRVRSAIRFVCGVVPGRVMLEETQHNRKCLRETAARTTPMIELAILDYDRRTVRLASMVVARTSQ